MIYQDFLVDNDMFISAVYKTKQNKIQICRKHVFFTVATLYTVSEGEYGTPSKDHYGNGVYLRELRLS